MNAPANPARKPDAKADRKPREPLTKKIAHRRIVALLDRLPDPDAEQVLTSVSAVRQLSLSSAPKAQA
jgi:hypothetical protein